MAAATAEAPNARLRRVPVPKHAAEPRGQIAPSRGTGSLGPLLAVCGLGGGAGATTLAYLIALAAARQWTGRCSSPTPAGPSGGLAACAGVEAPRSLGEVAQQLAAGAPARRRHLRDRTGRPAGARDRPRVPPAPAEHEVRAGLTDAREAHALTVIDCGTLARDADQTAATAATHVAWVLPATHTGSAAVCGVLEAAPPMAGKELIVARHDVRQARLRCGAQATRRRAPRAAGAAATPARPRQRATRSCAEAAQIPLQAILGALQR